jgi:SAM-dependent methyltransferase
MGRLEPPARPRDLTTLPAEPHSVTSKFNAYRDSYRDEVQRSIAFFPRDLEFFARAKARILTRLARSLLGDPTALDVLDVGCGVGVSHRFLTTTFRSLYGVDISKELVDVASRMNAGAHYVSYGGPRLPFESGSFDLAFAMNVLHHVPPRSMPSFVSDLRRVVRPGGVVVVFEHNPLNPLTRIAVRRCRFDDDCTLLRRSAALRLMTQSRLDVAEARYFLFFPSDVTPLRQLEAALGWLPAGAQYYVAARVSAA